MAEETGNAAFNEMLAIGIETDGFQLGLDKITEIYTSWIENLSSRGIDGSKVINTSSISGLGEVLSSVSGQITKVQESMAALSESVVESMGKATESTEKFKSSAKEAFSENAEQFSEIATARYVALKEEELQVANSTEVAKRKLNKVTAEEASSFANEVAQQYGIVNKAQIAQIEELTLAKIKSAEKGVDSLNTLARKNAQYQEAAAKAERAIEDKLIAEGVESYRKLYEERTALVQKFEQARQAAQEKSALAEARYEEQRLIAERKDTLERIKLIEKSSAEKVKIEQGRQFDEAILLGKQFTAEEKAAAESVKLAEKAAAERIKVAEEEAARIKEISQKRDYEQYVARGEGVEKPFKATGRGGNIVNTLVEGGSIGEMFSGIGASVVGLAAFQLEMAAATKVIELAVSPVTIFIATLKGGFEYLQQFQERSSIIKEVLVNTVQFSSNFGENLKIAGEQADVLLRKVDDLAIKLNVKSEVIQNGLNNFLEAGGRNLVNNNDEAVQLSGLVSAALQSQNPNIDARQVRTEFQKLVQGNEENNGKLAIALGLSGEKLRDMVERAKTFKDLLGEISEAAPGLADKIAGANDRQADLINTLEIYKNRFEALIVGPLFAQFTTILKEILVYLNEHEDEIKNIGIQLANAVGLAGEFTKSLLTQNWDGLVNVFKEIAKYVSNTAADVNSMVAGATLVGKLAINAGSAVEYKVAANQAEDQRAGDSVQYGKQVADANYAKKINELKTQFAVQSPSEILAEYKATTDKGNNTAQKFNSTIDALNNPVHKEIKLSSVRETSDFLKGSSDNLQADSTSNSLAKDSYEPPSISLRDINTKKKPTHGEEAEVSAKYQRDLELIKSQTDAALQIEKKAHEDGNINLKDYTQASIEIIAAEKADVADLIQYYRALAIAKAGKGQAVTEAAKFDKFSTSFDREATSKQNALINTEAKDENKAKDITDKGESAVDLANIKARTAELRDSDASSLAIARSITAEHREQYRITQLELIVEELNAAKVSESAREAVKQKLDLLDANNKVQVKNDNREENLAALKDVNSLLQEQVVANNSIFDAKKRTLDQDIASAKVLTSAQNAAKVSSELYQRKIELDQSAVQTNKDNLDLLEQQLINNVESNGKLEERVRLIKEITVQQAKLTESRNQVRLDSRTVDPTSVAQLERIVFSDTDLQKLSDVFTNGFAVGITDLTKAFTYFGDIAKTYNQGFKQGGFLGGVGSVLSGQGGNFLGRAATSVGGALTKFSDADSQVAGGASALGSIGGAVGGVLGAAAPFIGAIGPAFSLIGSLFTAAAKRIADQAKKDFEAVQTSYGEGNINLVEAIREQQNIITTTISKLSGQKGGQGELDAILPGMQQSLNALKQQQKQIFVDMDQAVNGLKLQQSYLSGVLSSWQQINSQVTQYVQAGGDLSTAAEFISQSLEKQKIQAADDLVAAESTAVQDAQNYNNLLIQRTQLIEQYNKQAFGEKNADSIERSQAGAVVRATQLQQETINYQTSLQAQNQQITQAQAKVDAEQKIFGIATDTASLQAESNTLALYSLNQQVKQWQAIQDIYNGIVKNADGNYTYTNALGALLGFTDGFGNSPTTNYNGVNTPIPGYSGGGVGNVGSIGVGYSAGGYGQLSSGALVTGAVQSNTVPTNNMQIGTINVTIQSSGGTIDAASIANDLQSELISRNQYAGSSYY